LSRTRDKTYVLICCAYIRGLFESQYCINNVGDVDWVSLPSDRNTWQSPLNIVLALQVVYKAGKSVANRATVSGTLGKRERVM
jgi:hypothetical protein